LISEGFSYSLSIAAQNLKNSSLPSLLRLWVFSSSEPLTSR